MMTAKNPSRLSRVAALLAMGIGFISAAQAQTAVSSVTYGASSDSANTSTTTTTGSTVTFGNTFYSVDSVTSSAGVTYTFDTSVGVPTVYLRRSPLITAGTGYTTVIELAPSSGATSVVGSAASSAGSFVSSPTTISGLKNPFVNGNSTAAANVERIDLSFGYNYTVKAGDAVVFYDLVAAGATASFQVAAFDKWDTATQQVISYATGATTVSSFGSALNLANGATTADYYSLTYAGGDSLSGGLVDATLSSGLQLVGVVVQLSDLGLKVGDTISGISLMAGDTNAKSGADLLNLSDTTVYNSGTSSSVDFMGFSGVIGRPVPEPSTYGLIFSGLGICSYGFMRIRRIRRSSKES